MTPARRAMFALAAFTATVSLAHAANPVMFRDAGCGCCLKWLEQVKASFGAASETTEPGADGFYLVNHTASVFLINKDGNFEGTIAYGEPTETAVAKIKKLIAS